MGLIHPILFSHKLVVLIGVVSGKESGRKKTMNNRKWISVNDRLPEEGYPLLYHLVVVRPIHSDSNQWGQVTIAQIVLGTEATDFGPGSSAFWELENPMHVPFTITHWMDLPKLPGDQK